MRQIKNFKMKFNIQIWYLWSNIMGQNVDFERVCKQEWMGMEFEYVRKLTQENDYCVLESNRSETHYTGSFPYMTF